MKYIFTGTLAALLVLILIPLKSRNTVEKEQPVKVMPLKKENQLKVTDSDAILNRKNILVNIL